jgi:small basic protein
MIAFVGLAIGALIALLLHPNVSGTETRYVAMVVVAAIDSAFGGFRSRLEQTFNDRVFLISFVLNALVAVALVWVGDQLAADVSTAVVVVFGIRIFQNVAAIRRRVFGG